MNLHINLKGVSYIFEVSISLIAHFTDGETEGWKEQHHHTGGRTEVALDSACLALKCTLRTLCFGIRVFPAPSLA